VTLRERARAWLLSAGLEDSEYLVGELEDEFVSIARNERKDCAEVCDCCAADIRAGVVKKDYE